MQAPEFRYPRSGWQRTRENHPKDPVPDLPFLGVFQVKNQRKPPKTPRNFYPSQSQWKPPKNFLSLSFFEIPCFFLCEDSWFFARFSLLFQGFGGFGRDKNPCFFGGFPCRFPKNKERKDRALKKQRKSSRKHSKHQRISFVRKDQGKSKPQGMEDQGLTTDNFVVKYTGRGLVVKRPGVLSKVQMLNLVLGVGVFSLLPTKGPCHRLGKTWPPFACRAGKHSNPQNRARIDQNYPDLPKSRFWEGDEDSNFSIFRVRRFSEWLEPLLWIAFPVEALNSSFTKLPPPFSLKTFFCHWKVLRHIPFPKISSYFQSSFFSFSSLFSFCGSPCLFVRFCFLFQRFQGFP